MLINNISEIKKVQDEPSIKIQSQIFTSHKSVADFLQMLVVAKNGMEEAKYNYNLKHNKDSKEKVEIQSVDPVDNDLNWEKPLHTRSEFIGSPVTKDELFKLLKPTKLSVSGFKKKLAKLGALCDYFFWCQDCSELWISTQGRNMLRIFKTQQIVDRLLKTAEKVGLIKWTGVKASKNAHRPKSYIWNIEVKRLILQLVKDYGLNKFNNNYIKRGNVILNCEEDDVEEVNDEEVEKFGEKGFIEKTFNVSISAGLRVAGCSDEQAKMLIHKKYPQIQVTQKMIDEDNLTLEDEDKIHQGVFKEKIKRSSTGFITSISIRETNDFCKYWSRDKAIQRYIEKHNCSEEEATYQIDRISTQKLFGCKWREDYIVEYFKNKGIDWCDVGYYDQKASIFFLNYYKKTGKIFEGDMYELIAGVKLTKEQRKIFKRYFPMKAMFDWSANSIYAKMKKFCDEVNQQLAAWDEKHKLDGDGEDYSKRLIEHFYNRLQKLMDNKNKCTEIFLDESCIYSEVVHILRKNGYVVCNVYDGFWFGKKGVTSHGDDIKESIVKVAKRYFKRYYNIDPVDVNCSSVSNQQSKYSYSKVLFHGESGVTNVTRLPLMYNTHTSPKEPYSVELIKCQSCTDVLTIPLISNTDNTPEQVQEDLEDYYNIDPDAEFDFDIPELTPQQKEMLNSMQMPEFMKRRDLQTEDYPSDTTLNNILV